MDTVYVRKEDWKECLSGLEEAYAVSWNILKSNKRSGTFSVARQPAMDLPIQKETKKYNSKAQLKVEYLTRVP
ncbi:hypothetical protein BDB01DRAFT_854780 [Pilobolus umbonatus]|nr:hypothetical protein BDB01DRAFT_854780 [Pilobolus umbonatus]